MCDGERRRGGEWGRGGTHEGVGSGRGMYEGVGSGRGMYEGVGSGRGMHEGVGSGRGMHEGVGSGRACTMYQGWEWVFVRGEMEEWGGHV